MLDGVYPGYTVPAIIRHIMRQKISITMSCLADEQFKNLNFWNGKLTSANSTLLDDRLGEILYRDGLLSLDDFFDAAGKVTKELRFGELLIQKGIFNAIELWEALGRQVISIAKSLCFYDSIEIKFVQNDFPPKFEFNFDTEIQLQEALADSEKIVQFSRALELHPELRIVETSGVKSDFVSDMISLVNEYGNFHSLVESGSRLSKLYTTRSLWMLLRSGILMDSWSTFSLPDFVIKDAMSNIEECNYMFRELAQISKSNAPLNWSNMIQNANILLQRMLGSGVYFDVADGFLADAILKSPTAMQLDSASQRNAHQEYSVFIEQLRGTLHKSIFFMFFELLNQNTPKEDLAAAKRIFDQLRFSSI